MNAKRSDASFVDSSACLADDVVIGRNTVISGNVRIGHGTQCGNNVTIEGEVEIGAGNLIGHNTVIVGKTKIGDENRFTSHCSIGQLPQHPEIRRASGGVSIGDRNVFREFVTIHAPAEVALTCVGSDCYVMSYCHIAHDCSVGNRVRMANGATLAGRVQVGDQANLGLHAVVHQGLEVGALCMIGMNSTITKHVPPFALIQDNRFLRLNRVGMQRSGLSRDEIVLVERWYRGIDAPEMSSTVRDSLLAFASRIGTSRVYRFRA